MSASQKAEIIVVGAGVLGLATAAELARRGLKPLVLDEGSGSNASRVAAGMLAPAFEAALEEADRDRADLYRMGRDLWPELAERAGIALDRSGADWVGEAEPLAGRMADLGFCVNRTEAGFHTPDDWALDAEAALERLAGRVREDGGELRRARVVKVEASSAGVHVETDAGAFASEAAVIAAGWAAPALKIGGLEELLGRIEPVKGQLLRLTGHGVRAVERVTRGPGVYLAPRRDGLIVGATMQPGRSDVAIEPEAIWRLQAAAVALAPALADARLVETRAGVRGAVADGLPLAGPTSAPGLSVALAPRRNGWLLGPLVARVVADGLAGKRPETEAFRAERAL